MINILAVLFIIVITLCVLSNFITLPGNWLMAFFVILWALFVPNNILDTWFFCVFFTLLIIGEALEFYLQLKQSKKAGASGTSNILGIIGAIIGAIICIPFLFGLGAIFGALAGAWLGTFVGEFWLGSKEKDHSVNAANAALWGKFLGMVIKFGIGFYLIFYTASYIFPEVSACSEVSISYL